jgi:hypothetical protein
MTKIVVAMSMSLDGIAGPETADADGMAIFTAILGWQFPLRSWRQEQGMEGGEDSVDSRVWAENFERFGPQVIGRTMFDFGYPNWGENPPFHAPVFVVTRRGGERITKGGGTSYTPTALMWRSRCLNRKTRVAGVRCGCGMSSLIGSDGCSPMTSGLSSPADWTRLERCPPVGSGFGDLAFRSCTVAGCLAITSRLRSTAAKRTRRPCRCWSMRGGAISPRCRCAAA